MKYKTQIVAFLLCAISSGAAYAADDILVADFDGDNYGNWKTEGTAFGTGPAKGRLGNQMDVGGFIGAGFVNSYLGGDKSTGKLSSPPFIIERPFINFKLGGGRNMENLGIRLRVNNRVVRTTSVSNDGPDSTEYLYWMGWDVSEFKGKPGILEIVDNATGGWGHISVDNIFQSDTLKVAQPRERIITASEPLLLLPIKNGGPKRIVNVTVDGQWKRRLHIELADGEPDWWAPLDLSFWKGKKVTVSSNAVPDGSRALEQIQLAQELPNKHNLYKEALRGQLRFSSKVGWINDPNGMVYSQGLYHLFYQHNPYGWAWGNMQWGHATSPDMVHWTEWPVAMYPQAPSDMVFSGSAVVDKNNTSGWKKGPNDLMVAAFTSTGRGECIRYSTDKGLTWTEYEGNPVVKHKGVGRDPRLIWHEPTKQWVMVVWSDLVKVPSERGGLDFYTSKDLKTWTFASRSGGWFECADLFELPLENGQKKWILTAGSSEYRVGTFDGKTFIPETPKLPGMQGRNYYAAQTFSHEPNGRIVQMAWFRTTTPGMPFNQSMSLPNELKLKSTPEGPRLTWTPAVELESLRIQKHTLGAQSISETDQDPLSHIKGELFEVRAEFEPGTADEIRFNVRGVPVVYNAQKGDISVGGFAAHAPLINGKQRLTIFVDRTGIDVFASDGLAFVPFNINLNPHARTLTLAVTGGRAKFSRLDVYDLKSSWQKGK